MSIEVEYYLSCNICAKVYHTKSDDMQDVEDMAIDDGWRVEYKLDDELCSGADINTHTCPKCLEKTK